jgi:hypothetical protein
MILYRPVGPRELELIEDVQMSGFPPRLPDQPIFYPVLQFEYAEQIARDWNSTRADTGYLGFVTRFDVEDAYASQFEKRTVGGRQHQELWVPAEDLDEFNRHLVGKIEVIAKYERGQRVALKE